MYNFSEISCGFPTIDHKNLVQRCSDKGYMGSQCHFSCLGNYKLSGPLNVKCTEDGVWTNTFPTCEGLFKQCSQFNNKPNLSDET